MKMINIPNCKFKLGNILKEKGSSDKIEYLIHDISYSTATGDWYYNYSYWADGFEHYCKSPIHCVERLFEIVR